MAAATAKATAGINPGAPQLQVTLGGVALDAAGLAQITAIRVLRALSTAAMAELHLDGLLPAGLPRLGAALTIDRTDRAEPLFEGTISAVRRVHRGGRAGGIALRAFDPLQSLRRSGAAETLLETTPADLARRFAERLGLSLEAAERGPRLPVLVRRERSDLEFLVNETRRFGLWLHVRGGALRLHGLDGSGPVRRFSIDADAIEAQIEANLDEALGSLAFTAWSPGSLDVQPGMAMGLNHAATAGGPDAGQASKLQLLDLAAADADEAMAVATAEMTRRDSARLVLRALVYGSRSIGLGDRLEIVDAGMEVIGPLVVTRLEERIDAVGGHVIELSTEPPPKPPADSAARAFWGRVVDNDDPEGCGRARFALPAFADVETGWLQVARPMTGTSRGFAYVPAIGDDWLLLAPGGRPEHSFAIGALNGRRGVALAEGTGDAVRFGFVTAAGHRLVFDDDAGTVGLETAGGSRWTLGPDGVRLSATGDLILEAPGHTVQIHAARIDMSRG